MTIKHIDSWCKQMGLSEKAIKEIEFIRSSEPSRRVRSGIKNVSGFYPSKKMGFTIQFESRTVELAAIYEKEHDCTVIEYYDQPPSFPINYETNGKKHGHLYTADFFVISENWVGWEEWKTEEDLIKLSEANPNRYCLNEDGHWISRAVEEYAEKRGLSFRVRVSKEINWTYQRNIRFLEDYFLNKGTSVSEDTIIVLQELVRSTPGITLKNLLNNNENYNADDIYTMIALDHLYIDLNETPIPQYDLVKVYIDKTTAKTYRNIFQSEVKEKRNANIIKLEIGNNVHWDGRLWTIINLGETRISLLSEDGKVIEIPEKTFKDFVKDGRINGLNHIDDGVKQQIQEIFNTAGRDELEEANRKYKYICQILNSEPLDSIPVPNRTLRHWYKNYREAEKIYGYGFIGLISKNYKKGNRNRRFPKKTIELMQDYIKEQYDTIIQKSKLTVYNDFAQACEEKGYTCPSFRTFCEEVDKQTEYEKTKNRKGRKAAYKVEPFYWYLEPTTPRHGDRPFEIAHIDHTQLDIELICSTTGKDLGRPWVTFMVDAFSRRILAAYLTFDDPSYRSDLMVMRECVKRLGRLPSIIVVDGGKDFQSTYFETFLAIYNVQKQERPASKPRFGSVCERLFGTTNMSFIHNLIGNTQLMTNVRQVSKEVSPKRHAVWTLPLLAEYLFKWVYEIYDTMEHSALGESPRDVFLNSIEKTGKREFNFIGYGELFQMLSLPTTKKGTAKVQPGHGVKINRFYYWSNVLYDPSIEGQQVEVRYDPFNLGIAYAYVKNRWAQLHSEYQIDLANRTEKEIQIVFEELRKRQRIQGQSSSISTKKLVEFLRSAQDLERLQLQRLKDSEVRAVFTVSEGGKSKKKEDKKDTATLKQTNDALTPSNKNVFKPNKRIVYGEF